MSDKKRTIWVDNLKIVAAYGVLLGHCYSLFIGQNPIAKDFLNSKCDLFLRITQFLYNGDMWVIAFCIISGYFAATKHFENVADVFKGIIKRYMRFVLPFILLAFIIVLLNLSIGFNVKTDFVANQWAGLPTEVTVSRVLRMIFLFNYEIDGPLWTLRMIFVGDIVIYLLQYILQKFGIRRKGLVYGIMASLTFILGIRWSVSSLLISCCFAGGVIFCCSNLLKKINGTCCLSLVCIMIVLLGGLQNYLASFVPGDRLSRILLIDRKWYLIWWFAILFLLFNKSEDVERLLGKRTLSKDVNHSFYVYILHTLVIKTAVVIIFSKLIDIVGFGLAAIISTISCIVITYISSVLFGKTYTNLSSLLNRRAG